MLQTFQNMDHFQQILDHLWSICATLYLCCTHCIIPESLLNHLNGFHGETFKLNTKFDADLLFCLLRRFECDGCNVPMLTQQCLLPPLTSTVKSSFSCMYISVHSPWLPGYINVTKTILVTLAMAGLFPDRYIFIFIYA